MSTERSAGDFFNMPPLQIDLSQAHSLRIVSDNGVDTGRTETTGNPHITQFRRVLEEVIGGLTKATQTALESQHHYFETVIKEFMDTVQTALNDIDSRLNLLSQAQAQTEDVLDAFLKVFMVGGNPKLDLTDQMELMNNFLQRGFPVPVVAQPEDTTPAFLTEFVNVVNANDQNGQASA